MEGDVRPMQSVTLVVSRKDGSAQEFPLQLRVQTAREIEYLKCGGLLPYVLEQLLASNDGLSSDADGPGLGFKHNKRRKQHDVLGEKE
jgi:aconitate hydratase